MRRARFFYQGMPLRQLRDPLNRLVKRVNADPLGTSRATIPIAYPSIELEIKTLGASTLTCVDPGAAADPQAREYTVVLPPTFTETSREGVSYTYTDINTRTADGSENQKMTPSYVVGDKIRAAYRFEGDGSLLDLNIDGRQWAKV